MPRININEKDRTSPGTPGGYSNNTVLIAGFSAYTDKEIEARVEDTRIKAIPADDNGIFEFDSADDFEKTIGLVAPDKYITPDEGLNAKLPAHYGNQMAYELLKMGYPVIYINLGKPYEVIDPEAEVLTYKTPGDLLAKLWSADTWELFKDKASYDFRFISHGLLTSADFAKSDDLIRLERRVAKMRSFLPVFNAETDIKEDETENAAKVRCFQEALDAEQAYIKNKNKREEREAIGYVKNENGKYPIEACVVYNNEGAISITEFLTGYITAETNIADQEKAIQDLILEAESNVITPANFDKTNEIIAQLAHYRAEVSSDGTEDEMHKVSGRGDCIALIEVDEANYITNNSTTKPENRIVAAINSMSYIDNYTGKYCACTVPSVVYNMTADERFNFNRKFPGAFHYLACFANSLGLGFAEWYAVAGYTRGVASYTIDRTTIKLGEIAVQALEPRNIKDQDTQPKFAVNVIANFRGNYYLWGNRTCHPLGDYAGGNDLIASHFLNIRQLCTTIKKQLYVSCRRFTFDPNSDILWINFKNSITPMLDRMKADQGVRDYKIEKVYTDKKATLKARIRIVPIEAVEDFLLEVSLEDSLGETAVTVTE